MLHYWVVLELPKFLCIMPPLWFIWSAIEPFGEATDSPHRIPHMDTSVASDLSQNCLPAIYTASIRRREIVE
jgi:hypothetical protein